MPLFRFVSQSWEWLKNRFQGEKARRFNAMLGFFLALWCTHALLRAAWLFRSDAYGLPLVGKADWYIFHAFCIDYLWILEVGIPLALLAALGRKTAVAAWLVLVAVHAFLLVFTVLDQETMRFLGMHLDPTLLSTYGNTASIREVFRFVADDQSVRYLPYALFFGCLPLAGFLYWIFLRKVNWTRADSLNGRVLLSMSLAALVAWLYLNVIWTGGFRMQKLRPYIETAWMGWIAPKNSTLSPAEFAILAKDYAQQWQAAEGDSLWVFPDSGYPYFRTTRHEMCADAIASAKLGLNCGSDRDQDGYDLARDCNDSDASVHPGAVDSPGDGIDQDCDGVDAHPWNLVLLIYESHRALNCGHLQPYGATASATPFLDSLAGAGRFWTRFQVGGVPTINALMATHLSVTQHPTRIIASDFVTMANQGFPAILARHGYRTDFFSAADPAWDNQTPWLRQWYHGIHYDRSRENDAATMKHMAQWMRDSLKEGRPFFMASMSKTNHYPFNPVAGVEELPAGASLHDRMLATTRYADQTLRDFIDSIKNEPWFAHTVFAIMGDHGFPLGEHGSSTIGFGLYSESTWIPFVVLGAHPRLPASGPQMGVAGQVDIGPTLLDLAGISDPNHYMGHSLLRPRADDEVTMVLRGDQGVVYSKDLVWHLPWGEIARERGNEVFDRMSDPLEQHNILKLHAEEQKEVLRRLSESARLHLAILESEKLWPLPLPKP